MTSEKKRVVFTPVYLGIVKMLESLFVEGRRTPGVLRKAFSTNRKWGGRDRRLVAEVVYESVRWWRRLYVACFGDWSDKSLPHHGDIERPTREQIIMCLNLQLALLEIELKGQNLQREFENEIDRFRKLDRYDSLASFFSLSDYFHDLGSSELDANWEPTIESLNEPAPVFLRLNRIKVDKKASLVTSLASEGIEVEDVSGFEDALRLKKRQNVFASEVYKRGAFEMQDAASQMVAKILNPQRGEKVIDACAGAGGKSLHLASLMGAKGKILSLDVTKWKLDELKKRAARAGADNIETRLIDGSKTIKRLRESADALILDVPCSGSGVLRRNADPKWQLNQQRFSDLLALQAQLLGDYTRMLKPGGRLLYSTCSVFPSENSRQVLEALRGPLDGWDLAEEFSNFPQINGHDGFYAALLRKPVS